MIRSFLYSLFVIPWILTAQSDFTWPAGKKAAIILTYDDGMATQLDHAIPQLNAVGLKGTFFINYIAIPDHADRWRKAALAGHELANHTLFHPCSKVLGGQWTQEWATENYTIDRLFKELVALNNTLYLIDGKKSYRTYAYPCTQVEIAGKNYVDTLRKAGIIRYARVGGDSIHTSLYHLDTMQVASWAAPAGTTAETMIRWVDRTIASGGLFVFQFHGIGGQWFNVPKEEHQKLLAYLQQKKRDIYLGTFKEVMAWVAKQKARS
jgi:peptidoglycan-N-acetylglucosamine deacetylase